MKKQTLGMMIASLRRENEMTQADLAEKMGVTDKAVSKWERDLSCPDVNSLPKLAEIFGLSVDELMQVKLWGKAPADQLDFRSIIRLVCKAICVAMGVALIVLSSLKEINLYSGFSMAGIGLACAGIALFQKDE